MSRKRITAMKKRTEQSTIWLNQLQTLVDEGGYVKLSDTPEIQAGVERISELIGSMTIHLMENTDHGDVRIKNGLSHKVDIEPSKLMTRNIFIQNIVKNMMMYGNAVVIPKYGKEDYLEDLHPLDMLMTTFTDLPDGYMIEIDDLKFYHDEVLHFKLNPSESRPWIGKGYKVYLRELAKQLNQATATTTDFMVNKMFPSVIIKVDALTDELASPEGKKEVYEKYVSASRSGEPWIVPADLFQIEKIEPLTLNDIAIKDTVELSKNTVAAILGVPAFLLGVGEFNRDEYNHFIRSRLMFIAQIITQELTKKLLYSPSLYFKFNNRSLYAYDTQELADMGSELFVRGIVTGNEVREWLGLSPLEGLDNLTILENYIPLDKIGDQEKLKD